VWFETEPYLESGEVNDTVDVWMRSKDLVQALLVCDVDLVKFRSLSAEQLNAIEGNLRGVVQAVDNHDLVAMLEQRK
jgi:hypothetical protein